MEVKEFNKTIRIEELATRDGERKVMAKSYLDILLRGGKTRKRCFLYSVGKPKENISFCNEIDKPLKDTGIQKIRNDIIKSFKEMKRKGFWETETEHIDLYNAKDHVYEPGENEATSKIIKTTTETMYFLDRPYDIKQFTGK